MSFEPFDELMEKDLTPEEYITELFERTDEDGVLYLPAKYLYFEIPELNFDYCCRMNWNLSKYEAVMHKFSQIYKTIKELGKYGDATCWDESKAKEKLGETNQYQIWQTYVRPYDMGGMSFHRIFDIDDRLESIALAQDIAMRYADGKKLKDYEREYLEEHLNVEVTEEEEEYYSEYHRLRIKQSEERVGKNFYAYETVLFAIRLCRLIELGAPDVIMNNEALRFAEMFVLHEYAAEVKHASSAIREQKEKLEQMSDDELDEMDCERPQANSAKSLLPLFVHQILGKHSSAQKHLHQQEIIDYLKQPPYEITVERKAISRTLYTLNNWFPDSVLCDKDGWWKE